MAIFIPKMKRHSEPEFCFSFYFFVCFLFFPSFFSVWFCCCWWWCRRCCYCWSCCCCCYCCCFFFFWPWWPDQSLPSFLLCSFLWASDHFSWSSASSQMDTHAPRYCWSMHITQHTRTHQTVFKSVTHLLLSFLLFVCLISSVTLSQTVAALHLSLGSCRENFRKQTGECCFIQFAVIDAFLPALSCLWFLFFSLTHNFDHT